MLYARKSNFSLLLSLRLLRRSAYSCPAALNNCSLEQRSAAQLMSSMHIGCSAKMHKCLSIVANVILWDMTCSYGGSSSSSLAAAVCSRLSSASHKLVEIVVGVAVRDVSVCKLVDGWASVTLCSFGMRPKLCGGYGRSRSLAEPWLAETETGQKLTFDPALAPKFGRSLFAGVDVGGVAKFFKTKTSVCGFWRT